MTQAPRIGKYVIENLTVAMYDDSRSVYREYIQNSADALDKAIAQNLIAKKDATIHIQINKDLKSISIEDNGTGIGSDRVVGLLQNIAQSEKEIGKEKGFRGIGRLGGIGYCESLIFETSAKGEGVKSIMTWDAKQLRLIVNSRENKETASEVIAKVTTFNEKTEDEAEHYFKVIMRGVTNEELLDFVEINNYLSIVAPVPFDSGFHFKNEIYTKLEEDGFKIDEYNVFLNTEQLYKSYTEDLFKKKGNGRTPVGKIKALNFFKEYDRNNNILFWGWHSVSDIQGQRLDISNKARGLRLRKDNIQIGDERRLDKLFRDTRFNFYVVGEVYGFSPKLIPNGRRDDFVENDTYLNFKKKLRPVCLKVQAASYDASRLNSALRKIDTFKEEKKKYSQKKKKGFIDKEDEQRIILELEAKKQKADEGLKDIQRLRNKVNQTSINEPSPLSEILKNTIPKTKPLPKSLPKISKEDNFRTDKIDNLTDNERKLLSRVFRVINRTLDTERAEFVIDKIEEEFK